MLLVRHDEDAGPPGRRFLKEILLAALPVSARGAVIGPLVEKGLESSLGVFPAAPAIKCASLLEELKAAVSFFRIAVDAIFARPPDELINGDRLNLPFDANEIELA